MGIAASETTKAMAIAEQAGKLSQEFLACPAGDQQAARLALKEEWTQTSERYNLAKNKARNGAN